MDHANVLKIIGHCVEAPPFLTVLESCPDVSCYIVIDIITHTHTWFWCICFSFLEFRYGFVYRRESLGYIGVDFLMFTGRTTFRHPTC